MTEEQMADNTMITATQEKLRTILADRFDQHIDFGDGTFAIPYGSASVMLVVRPYTETDTIVELIANVASEANITTDVMHWLLRKNAEIHLGGFGLIFDDTIVYSYAISGNTVTADSLEAAITSVAVIADYYDDEIIRLAGGKREID